MNEIRVGILHRPGEVPMHVNLVGDDENQIVQVIPMRLRKGPNGDADEVVVDPSEARVMPIKLEDKQTKGFQRVNVIPFGSGPSDTFFKVVSGRN